MKQKRTELSVRLDAGGVCIQAEAWGDMNVARIRFPKGAESGHRERAKTRGDTAITLG